MQNEIYKFKSLIKEPKCCKNPDNLTCLDLLLTNYPNHYKATSISETGLSDFHKMILTVVWGSASTA